MHVRQAFPIPKIFAARPAISFSLSRRAPFELLSPLGVVIFSKELVEFRWQRRRLRAHERQSMRPRRGEALMILKWMRVMYRPFRFSPTGEPKFICASWTLSSPKPSPRFFLPLPLPQTAIPAPGSLGLGYLVSSGLPPLLVCPLASSWNCFLL